MSMPREISDAVDAAVVPVGRPVAADDQVAWRRSGRDRSRRSRPGCAESVKSKIDTPPWYQRLDHDVAARHRDERSVVRDAVLLVGLRRRQLEVAAGTSSFLSTMSKIASAPQVELIGRAAARLRAAAPLVGEDHLGAVVVERRRVPVGEVLVRRPRRGGPGSPDPRCRAGCRCPSTRRPRGRRRGKTVMSWHWFVTARRLRALRRGRRPSRARRSRRSSDPRRCAGG